MQNKFSWGSVSSIHGLKSTKDSGIPYRYNVDFEMKDHAYSMISFLIHLQYTTSYLSALSGLTVAFFNPCCRTISNWAHRQTTRLSLSVASSERPPNRTWHCLTASSNLSSRCCRSEATCSDEVIFYTCNGKISNRLIQCIKASCINSFVCNNFWGEEGSAGLRIMELILATILVP